MLARFDELHRTLHAWQPSDLSRLNTALARGERAPVTPELAAMLRDAQALSIQSNDLFNPAIGGLIALWGFHADAPQSRVPDAAAIAEWVNKQPRMADLAIENGAASSANPAVQLDLGGYAKGRALDDAVAILKTHGVKNALVNIGGNVIALGAHGDRPWRVGIQHPRQPGTLATLDLHDGEAVGTSGDYQRYFEIGGKTLLPSDRPAQRQPGKRDAVGDGAGQRRARRHALGCAVETAVHRRRRAAGAACRPPGVQIAG